MTQTATYTMEAFVDDVKEIFASTKDPLAQAQAVADHMQVLLDVPDWLEEKLNLPEEGGFGRYDLHYDENSGSPEPGFLLMCTVQKPGQDNLPHDHGAAWVVYGVYEGAIEQTKCTTPMPILLRKWTVSSRAFLSHNPLANGRHPNHENRSARYRS